MKKNIIKIWMMGLAFMIVIVGCSPQSPNEESKKEASGEAAGSTEESLNTPWLATKNTTRVNTSDSFKAAVLVSNTLWPATSDDNRPGGVVLVNPDDWQTALVSTDLIHFPNNGPVLFTNKDQIPDVTMNELERLKPTGADANQGVQVILVGDLDQKVEDQVKSKGYKVDRIKASSPADYAKAIDAYYAKVSDSIPQSVVVGSMDSPEYTVPAANWISHMPEPLLYVKKDEIPQETIDALQTREGKANIYLIGPKAAVSTTVEQQLKEYGKVTRISGEDPYENAIAFAKFKDKTTQFGWGITTSGHNVSFIPSGSTELAIAAAPFSHAGKHAPLLWTDKDKMPDSVMSYLMSIQPKYKLSPAEGPYNHAWLTGDEKALSPAAQGEIDSMLEIVSETGGGHGNMPGMEGTDDNNQNQDDQSDMPGMNH